MKIKNILTLVVLVNTANAQTTYSVSPAGPYAGTSDDALNYFNYTPSKGKFFFSYDSDTNVNNGTGLAFSTPNPPQGTFKGDSGFTSSGFVPYSLSNYAGSICIKDTSANGVFGVGWQAANAGSITSPVSWLAHRHNSLGNVTVTFAVFDANLNHKETLFTDTLGTTTTTFNTPMYTDLEAGDIFLMQVDNLKNDSKIMDLNYKFDFTETVPEPSSSLLMGLGLAGLLFRRSK